MKTIDDIRSTLAFRELRRRSEWFSQVIQQEPFTVFAYSLNVPTQKEASLSLDALDQWIIQWRELVVDGVEVQWKSVNWSWLGGKRLVPYRVQFLSAEGVYSFLSPDGTLLKIWKRGKLRLKKVAQRGFADGLLALIHERKMLWDAADEEFERYLSVCCWLIEHYPVNCYVREIPVEGVDTKWLEKHLRAVWLLCIAKMGFMCRQVEFLEAWGFKMPPKTIRVRHGQLFVDGLSSEDFVQLTPKTLSERAPKAVVIVENLQTGLSLAVPSSIPVFMGLGFAIDVLKSIRWMKEVPIFYFGDLDAHGLLILSNLRELFPQTQSFLMGEETLQKWIHLAVKDPTESLSFVPKNLTNEELAVFFSLQRDRLRLEQERIAHSEVNATLTKLLKKFVEQ